jgi:hypothetical protein
LSDTNQSPDETGAEQTPQLQTLDRVILRKVTPGDMLEPNVLAYLTRVIMAPLPDEQQTQQLSDAAAHALRSGAVEAHWVIGSNGKRVGATAYSCGPYSDRPVEKDIRVLYVVGLAIPAMSPEGALASIIEEGKQVARIKGCKNIIFDVAPNGPLTQAIISAALNARAQARFILEV